MTLRTFRDGECLGRLYNQCGGLLEEDAAPSIYSELRNIVAVISREKN